MRRPSRFRNVISSFLPLLPPISSYNSNMASSNIYVPVVNAPPNITTQVEEEIEVATSVDPEASPWMGSPSSLTLEPPSLPRCAVLNYRKEGDLVHWNSCVLRNYGGIAARVRNFDEAFELEEFSSQQIGFYRPGLSRSIDFNNPYDFHAVFPPEDVTNGSPVHIGNNHGHAQRVNSSLGHGHAHYQQQSYAYTGNGQRVHSKNSFAQFRKNSFVKRDAPRRNSFLRRDAPRRNSFLRRGHQADRPRGGEERVGRRFSWLKIRSSPPKPIIRERSLTFESITPVASVPMMQQRQALANRNTTTSFDGGSTVNRGGFVRVNSQNEYEWNPPTIEDIKTKPSWRKGWWRKRRRMSSSAQRDLRTFKGTNTNTNGRGSGLLRIPKSCFGMQENGDTTTGPETSFVYTAYAS